MSRSPPLSTRPCPPTPRAYRLGNLGFRLAALGRREDALAITVQAVDIRRRLASGNRTAFEPDLARGLWVFARVRVAGQAELPQALTAGQESVALFERLFPQRPQAVTGDLRGALVTVADVLDGLGRGPEADPIRRRIDALRFLREG